MWNIAVSSQLRNRCNDDEECDIESKLPKSINTQPGIRYRELLRLFGLTNGVLTYHISTLEKSRQIIVDRNNKTKATRYYSNKFLNMWTLTLYWIELKNVMRRKMVRFLSVFFISIYLYGIVGTMLLKADITSFKFLPELVNTSST
jgi:hypothetical protein